MLAQRLRQRISAELRITLRPRKHPDVGDEFDPILLHERKEDVDLARRMSNRPNARNHFWLFCFHEVPSYVSVPIKKRKMKKSLLSAIVGFTTLALMQGADTKTQPAAGDAAPDFSLPARSGSTD